MFDGCDVCVIVLCDIILVVFFVLKIMCCLMGGVDWKDFVMGVVCVIVVFLIVWCLGMWGFCFSGCCICVSGIVDF